MSDPHPDAETIKAALLERIVSIMKLDNASSHPYAVIDPRSCRILIIGDGSHETHLPLGTFKEHPHRYAIIPGREQIETVGLIRDFILRHFLGHGAAMGAAIAALNRSSSSVEWRDALGESHEVIAAFNAYMSEFRAVIAGMLINETRTHGKGA
jgi:hypothetical protein